MNTPASLLPDSIRTDRLLLRRWRDEDLVPFAELNSDPEVMTYMPALLDRPESDALATRIREQFDHRGFGLWAVEVPDVAPFIGYVGLSVPRFTAAFTPCVEVGWRLARAHWGQGAQQEANHLLLQFGFDQLGLRRLMFRVAVENTRAEAAFRKLGASEWGRVELFSRRQHRMVEHRVFGVEDAEWQMKNGFG